MDPTALLASLLGSGGAGAALAVAAMTWVPRLARALRERRAAQDASALSRAQADEVASRAWAGLAAELRAEAAELRAERATLQAAHAAEMAARDAQREHDRAEWREGLATARAAERECLDRFEALARDHHRTQHLVGEIASRLAVRSTPSCAHETVHSSEVAAVDPLATTPPAGSRLDPPAAPPTAQLDESETPSPWSDDTSTTPKRQ